MKVIPKGPVWRRHLDQLRPRYGADQDDDPGFRAKPTQELHTKEGSNVFKKSDKHRPSVPRDLSLERCYERKQVFDKRFL